MICILFSKVAGSHSISVESVGKNGRSNLGKKMVELLDRQIEQNLGQKPAHKRLNRCLETKMMVRFELSMF